MIQSNIPEANKLLLLAVMNRAETYEDMLPMLTYALAEDEICALKVLVWLAANSQLTNLENLKSLAKAYAMVRLEVVEYNITRIAEVATQPVLNAMAVFSRGAAYFCRRPIRKAHNHTPKLTSSLEKLMEDILESPALAGLAIA